MSKIAFVTDSETCIPTNLMQEYNIHEVPNYILWSGKDYRIGLDIITADVLYRLDTDEDFPTTAAAPAHSYYELFTRLLAQGYDVLAVIQSDTTSRCFFSAQEAANSIDADNLMLVNAKTLGMALGLALLQTARAAQTGATLQECAEFVQSLLPNTGLIGTIDTLKQLQRSGRISGVQRYIASMLRVKPLLEYKNEAISPAGRVRTRSKAVTALVEMLQKRVEGRETIKLSVMHCGAEADAHDLAQRCQDILDVKEVVVVEVSAGIAVHFGRGALVICYITGDE